VQVRADGLTGQKPPEAGADDAEPHDRAPVTVVNKGVDHAELQTLNRPTIWVPDGVLDHL
jgi:hypothetical protein